MQKPEELFGRYIWFVNTLLQAGDEGLTLAELNDKWCLMPFSGGTPFSRTTFNRYREVVEVADVLGYDIVWQKRRDC